MAFLFDLPPLGASEDRSAQPRFETTATHVLRTLRRLSEQDRTINNGFVSRADEPPIEWTLYDRDLLLRTDSQRAGAARLDIMQRGFVVASLDYHVEGIVPGTVNSVPDLHAPDTALYQPEAALTLYSRQPDTSIAKATYSSLWGGWSHSRELDWPDDGNELFVDHTPSPATLAKLGQSSRILTVALKDALQRER